MQVQLTGARVFAYGTYGGTKPLTYERGDNAGRVIEYVDFLCPTDSGETEMRRMTLSPTINGSRPPQGSVVDVLATVTGRDEVFFKPNDNGQGFREQIVRRDKWRAVVIQAAAEPEPEPAATGRAARG